MDLSMTLKQSYNCRVVVGSCDSASLSVQWGESPHCIPSSPVNKTSHESIHKSLAEAGKQEGTDLMCLPFPGAAQYNVIFRILIQAIT